MAVAVSIPLSLTGSLHQSLGKPPYRSSTAPTMSSPVSIPRKPPVAQQLQFGRYQSGSASAEDAMGTLTSTRNPSSISLETLAALLTPDQIDGSLDSPPMRSKGFYTYSTIHHEPFRKSKSFPEVSKRPTKSSLHSNKRPKVVRSRSVRFADSTGLPLEHVRALTAADPFQTEGEIVASLESDLGSVKLLPDTIPTQPSPDAAYKQQHTRSFKFPQPGTQPDFYQRLRKQKICLESIKSETRALHGIIRVLNVSYSKEVTARWTHDNWTTYHDACCTYCPGSSDGKTDRFSFTLPANGDDIQLALRYKVAGHEHWDSNNGHNYIVALDQSC